MSEDNPWQGWYQDGQPSSAASDANSDRTASYPMPGYTGSPGAGGSAWPAQPPPSAPPGRFAPRPGGPGGGRRWRFWGCLLYTSDAADDLLCVDLGGRRIIKKKKT